MIGELRRHPILLSFCISPAQGRFHGYLNGMPSWLLGKVEAEEEEEEEVKAGGFFPAFPQ